MPAYVEMLAHLSNDQWLELVRWRLGHPSAESLQTYLEAVNSVHSNPFLQAEQAELTNMVERAVGKSKGFKKGGDRLDEVLAMATWSGHALLERHRLPDQTLKTVWEPLETLIPLDSVLALDQFHYSTDYGPNTENVGRFIYGLLCLSAPVKPHETPRSRN